jgi:hypothetical protein
MPRKKRISRTRLGYTSAHIFQLCVGFDFFHDAFKNNSRAMRQAWPILKAEVMKMWKFRVRAGSKPWGCRFDKRINA